MRLIDADALKEYVKEQTNLPLPKSRLYMVVPVEDFITNLIDNQPTVDAEPVKHGRWIEVSDGSGYVGEPCEACSVCGMQTDYPSNYCPNCGAKMDEVEE